MAKFDDVSHNLELTKVYVLGGVDIVPHHTEKGMYVGPGNVFYRETYIRLVADCVKEIFLWPRCW